jgi:hypothetical protein
MAQSFADWEKQLAEGSIAGGALGTPTSGAGAISAETASSPLYAKSVMDLLSKMQGSNDVLQGFYNKGLTPQQVLFGQTGTAAGTHAGGGTDEFGNPVMVTDRPSNDVSMPFYEQSKLKNQKAMFYDPTQGVISPEANIKESGGLWGFADKYLPMAIMTALTLGGGAAIGAVGGAGGLFGGSNLLGSVPKGASFLDQLGGGGTGGSPATGAKPNAASTMPLLAILALLSRFGKKG